MVRRLSPPSGSEARFILVKPPKKAGKTSL